MYADAEKHLSQADKTLAGIIKRVGPCGLDPGTDLPLYGALIRSIAHQQLHGKAAATILGRFHALYPGHKFPPAEMVVATADEALRGVGFSRSKAAYIKGIALAHAEGRLPTNRQAAKLSDAQLIEKLTGLHGVGEWTVQMLLIFTFGRNDILPANDFGVRQGFKLAYKQKEMPTPKALAKHGERWAPYRSVAAWYLWRAVDLLAPPSKSAKPAK